MWVEFRFKVRIKNLFMYKDVRIRIENIVPACYSKIKELVSTFKEKINS